VLLGHTSVKYQSWFQLGCFSSCKCCVWYWDIEHWFVCKCLRVLCSWYETSQVAAITWYRRKLLRTKRSKGFTPKATLPALVSLSSFLFHHFIHSSLATVQIIDDHQLILSKFSSIFLSYTNVNHCLYPALTLLNAVHIFKPCHYKIHFSMTFNCPYRSHKSSHSLRFSGQNFVSISNLPYSPIFSIYSCYYIHKNSLESDSHSASQEILRLVWKRTVHCLVHKGPCPDAVESSSHAHNIYSIHFNIIFNT
jgi:hypothetical protein